MIKRFLGAALVVFGGAVGSVVQAQEVPSLVSPVTAKNGAEFAMPDAVGVRHIEYNSALARSSLSPGSRVQVPLPSGARVMLEFEKSQRNPSGSMTWVGRLAGSAQPYQAIITDDGDHVFGRIVTPEGEYLLRTVDGAQQLLDPRAAGMERLPLENDEAVPPPSRSADQRATKSTPLAESAGPEEMATIDVLLAYSTGLADELGSGLQTRLDYLISLANQAYDNSGIYQRVRVVHSVEIDHGDTESHNGYVLEGMTPVDPRPTPASLSALPSLRDTYGADLVAFLRLYQYPEHGGCGAAWVLGLNNAGTVVGKEAYGYSVTSDGFEFNDGRIYYCDDLTLAHELGHNMGSTHDRGHTSNTGVFPYSYGHGYDEIFGTVMSYLVPSVPMFSTPHLNCDQGLPCGIADPDPQSADNVRSINNTRFEVAAFRSTEVPVSCTPADARTLQYALVTETVTTTACSIVAGPSYTVSYTADVVFSVNESITLRPGFRVETGGQFAATINPNQVPLQ